LAEQGTFNPKVAGSIPARPIVKNAGSALCWCGYRRRPTAFKAAADDAKFTADAEVRSETATFFSSLDATVQGKIEAKFRSMICEARLYAQDQHGDVELFKGWIDQEFKSIDVVLTQYGMDEVSEWLAAKVNDKTSLYSLACMAWVRGTQ
jgi:hypothetical protein